MAAPDLLAGLSLPTDGPFEPAALLTATAQVREFCGWHIAPSYTETVLVSVVGGVALLPSLYVTDVASVDGLTTGFTWSQTGRVVVGSPRMTGLSLVTFTHGYDSCPRAVLSAVLQLAQSELVPAQRVRQTTAGPYTTSFYDLPPDPLSGVEQFRRPVVA